MTTRNGDFLLSPQCNDKKALSDAVYATPTSEEGATVTSSFSNDSSSASFGKTSPNQDETRSPPLPSPSSRTPPGKPRSAEQSIQKFRLLRSAPPSFDTAGVVVRYDEDSIVEEDIQTLMNKSSLMSIVAWNPIKRREVAYEGQMSIVQDSTPGNQENQFFMTCQHNVHNGCNADDELEFVLSTSQILPGDTPRVTIPFPGQGDTYQGPPQPLRNGHSWSSGPEVCRGPGADLRSLLHAPALQEFREAMEPTMVVDANFRYLRGTKVAIVAYTINPLKLDGLSKNFPLPLWMQIAKNKLQSCFPHVFGPCPVPNLELDITTGTITRDAAQGETHVEYNVNTVGGHSGALVIVWDKNHPYHGQAIAVHVGYKEELGANIGFQLQGMNFN